MSNRPVETADQIQASIDSHCRELSISRILKKVRVATAESCLGETYMQAVGFPEGFMVFFGFDARSGSNLSADLAVATGIRDTCAQFYWLKQASWGDILWDEENVVLNLPILATDTLFLKTPFEQPTPLLLLLKSRLNSESQIDQCLPSFLFTAPQFTWGDRFTWIPSWPYSGLRFMRAHWPHIISADLLKEEWVS